RALALLMSGVIMYAACSSDDSSGSGPDAGGDASADAGVEGGTGGSGATGGSAGSAGSAGAAGSAGSAGGSSSGMADCDDDGVPETQLGTVEACSACGDVCVASRAEVRCVSGTCAIDDCADGWADCDKDYFTGCETDLTQQQSCGACDVDCGDPATGAECVQGICQVTQCPDGFDDCNNDFTDGCETPLTTLANCGFCGEPCSLPNATASCETGSCQIACKTVCTDPDACTLGECLEKECAEGWGDCNNDPSDGCEMDLNSLGHCGGCNQPCKIG